MPKKNTTFRNDVISDSKLLLKEFGALWALVEKNKSLGAQELEVDFFFGGVRVITDRLEKNLKLLVASNERGA